uniref:G_PROTEIN_RECEP_F1_2 domain-containing protein n=1 Tax=Bursaphelenchus xylophilus TaxID=6326 RepID=A0A1I7RZN4_BURXY
MKLVSKTAILPPLNSPHFQCAIPQIIASISVILMLLWPVFAYSKVSIVPATVNHSSKELTYLKKCGFLPPPEIEIGFSVVACMLSYAIPLFGIIFWYMSVPLFLRKRAENTMAKGGANGTADVAVRKVITTVLVLTIVYVVCWTPYWISLFLHRIFPDLLAFSNKNIVFIFYMVHMLPYISCCAYPLIFTVMNRAIQKAHAEVMNSQRRRFKSITEDVTRHIRDALSFRIWNRDNHLFPRSSISVATCTTAQRIGLVSPTISARSNLRPQGSSLNLLASANSVSFSNLHMVSETTPLNPSPPTSPIVRIPVDEGDERSETCL